MSRQNEKLAVNLKFKSPGEVSEEEEIATFERVFRVLGVFDDEPTNEEIINLKQNEN